MAEPTVEGVGSDAVTLREQGARTVRTLGEVSTQLMPLRAKKVAGKKLTKKEMKLLADLEGRYRDLEGEMHHLLRPRVRDPWLYGMDHTHGPDNPRE